MVYCQGIFFSLAHYGHYIFLQTICVGVIVMWWLSTCVEYRRSKAGERVNWVSTIKRHFHV